MDLSKLEDNQLDMLLTLTTIGMQTLSQPNFDAKEKGVTVYWDEKTKKDLPENPRAVSLIEACGYTRIAIPVRGDVFVTRIEEYMEEGNMKPTWQRCDFTMKDCSSDAPWVTAIHEYRIANGIQEKEDRTWFENLKDDVEVLPHGSTEDYVWRQTEDDVEITFNAKAFLGIKATKRDITVKIGERSILVRLRGRMLLDGELPRAVETEDSCWTYDKNQGELQITLVKVKKGKKGIWKNLCTPRAKAESDSQSKDAQAAKKAATEAQMEIVPEAFGLKGGEQVVLQGLSSVELNGRHAMVLPLRRDNVE